VTETVCVETPAKLNLGLRLTGVREDGYHLLESVFAPIELFDRLTVEVLPGPHQIELEVTTAEGADLPPALSGVTAGPGNLAHRAAEAFCKARGLEIHVRMRLEKSIPAAAGMGGGSSDAAAVLTGLARLTGGSEAGLEAIALGLGADIPFFLAPQTSLVTGIGEIITPLEGLPNTDLVIANPGISLDTAAVYQAADAMGSALTAPKPGSTMRAFSRLCHQIGDPRDTQDPIQAARSVHLDPHARSAEASGLRLGASRLHLGASRLRDSWGQLLVNDLEPAACRLCPPVGRLLAAMREVGAVGAGMTGSGATVFGVFESKQRAAEAAAALVRPDRVDGRAQRDIDRERASSKGDAAWVRVSRLLGNAGSLTEKTETH
jgi:4-diphosphocytidyl-2-C-methyl-D-erythritol kinase